MKNQISTEEIVNLYTIKHLTLREISNHYGNITAMGVQKRLKSAGITSKDGEWAKTHCSFCGKPMEIRRKRWFRNKESFCTTECFYANRENPGYHPWRQGQRLARAIVSQWFRLSPGNIIHHVDGNCRNNDLSNLMVFNNHSEHLKHHHGKSKTMPTWDGSKIKEHLSQS